MLKIDRRHSSNRSCWNLRHRIKIYALIEISILSHVALFVHFVHNVTDFKMVVRLAHNVANTHGSISGGYSTGTYSMHPWIEKGKKD
jgi:hypothetical protein